MATRTAPHLARPQLTPVGEENQTSFYDAIARGFHDSYDEEAWAATTDLFEPERAPALLAELVAGQSAYVDLWLAETQSSMAEARASAAAVADDPRPLWISFTLDDDPAAPPRLRSGEPVAEAARVARPRGRPRPAYGSIPQARHEDQPDTRPPLRLRAARVSRDGVVLDPDLRREAILSVARSTTAAVMGVASSGLPGPSGNKETFVWLAEPGRDGALEDTAPPAVSFATTSDSSSRRSWRARAASAARCSS